MNVSDSEKLILLMLTELYDSVGVDGEINPDFIRSAIYSDKTWSIPWKYSGIPFEDQDTPEVVTEVLDILEMWSVIEFSYAELSDDEKALVEKGATPFGKKPTFKGFDGNNETEYMSTASFIVNDLERFEEFKGRNFNSHSQSIDTYNRMQLIFEEIKKNIDFYPLNAQQLIQLLKEKIHPEHRK